AGEVGNSLLPKEIAGAYKVLFHRSPLLLHGSDLEYRRHQIGAEDGIDDELVNVLSQNLDFWAHAATPKMGDSKDKRQKIKDKRRWLPYSGAATACAGTVGRVKHPRLLRLQGIRRSDLLVIKRRRHAIPGAISPDQLRLQSPLLAPASVPDNWED